MVLVWVVARPSSAATLQLAYLDAAGRVIEGPIVRRELDRADAYQPPPSACTRAREAAVSAEHFALSAAAEMWNVPAQDCEISIGCIVHRQTMPSIRHAVWVDIVPEGA
jgi:hypothetical protein